ncbi:AraC family transcriptional regulator [Cohnella fermenti]|uniref:AraC family transcriptional regulator n=1 Tax=Cohnella fermenti TaxID=2565925 RepID=A0A4S4BUD6_9BACL|nr:AraC family transcriptional regulator [Cohnella fermenti]THF76529.1 AraC family transcriptional regulator [Cohnella fermenti]
MTAVPAVQQEDAYSCLDLLWVKFRAVRLLRQTHFKPQLLYAHGLVVVKQGEGHITLDLGMHRLDPDTVRFIAPGQTIGFSEEQGSKLEVYLFTFDLHWDQEVPPNRRVWPLPGVVAVKPDHALYQLCEAVSGCSRSGQALERFSGQTHFQKLLSWIFNHIRREKKQDSRLAMDRTRSYMESHYSESITIDQLARMAEVSPKYYVSLFKKTYGKTAIDYLTGVRVNRAKQLMLQEDMRLKDIAYRVGYNDEYYFSRMFKKEVGISPTAYLRKRRQKVVAYSATVLGQLLALQIMPYAAPLHPKWTSYYYTQYRYDIPLHLSGYRFNEDWEANLDVLKQARMDCIISTDQLHPPEKERLEQLAPVHVVPLYERGWRDQLADIAAIVNADDEARVWLERYDEHAARVRERLHEALQGETVLIVSLYNDRFFLFPSIGMRDVFADLALRAPEGAAAYGGNKCVSLAELSALEADHILLNVRQESVTLDHWERLRTTEAWQDVRAVRRGCVHHISSDPWREYSAHAAMRMVQDVYERLCDSRALDA